MITEMMDEKKGHAEDEAEHMKQHVMGCIWCKEAEKKGQIFFLIKISKNRI